MFLGCKVGYQPWDHNRVSLKRSVSIHASNVHQSNHSGQARNKEPLWLSSVQDKTKRANLHLDLQFENQGKICKVGPSWSCSSLTDLKNVNYKIKWKLIGHCTYYTWTKNSSGYTWIFFVFILLMDITRVPCSEVLLTNSTFVDESVQMWLNMKTKLIFALANFSSGHVKQSAQNDWCSRIIDWKL